jgi:imidazoleglycerol-phosphate dehydratase
MTERSRRRAATVSRTTRETQVEVELCLDGEGRSSVATGCSFFDHMLELFAYHGALDLSVQAWGDLQVDAHHTVEDVGIVLGQAFREALGDKAGIRRYGAATIPMDESLVTVAVDLSGRPYIVWQVAFPVPRLGDLDSELLEEFWRAVAHQAGMNFHALLHHGKNGHHIAEAVFKAAGRALRQATEWDERLHGVPSTKGVLS